MKRESGKHIFDNPKNVKIVLWALYGVCGVLLLLDLFFHRHIAHEFETLFGFYPFYGFVACVLLVLIAKEMRKVLMRDEDYYDEQ